jgi:hypothetical protein
MTYKFPAGGVGGGAEAFTDLTDAPPAITANAALVGNAAGDAVEFSDYVMYDPPNHGVNVNAADPDTEGKGAYLGALAQGASATLYADAEGAQFGLYQDGQGFNIKHSGNSTEFEFLHDGEVATADLMLTGLDVAATDTNARLTVGESSLGITKAIQVKIGSDTHYWPLFGGEDAGPAPVPAIINVHGVDATSGAGFATISGGNVETGVGGEVYVCGGASGDGDRGPINLYAGAININEVPAIATQSVDVPGAGSLAFTHGLLTGFDDSSPTPLGGGSPGGASTFVDLTDVAGDYAGNAGKLPLVNAAADGLTVVPDDGQALVIAAGASSTAVGGAITITTGEGAAGSYSGNLTLKSADGDIGAGTVQISAGEITGESGTGGALILSTGDGVADGDGGLLRLVAGAGGTTGKGGNLLLFGGIDNGGGGGYVSIATGIDPYPAFQPNDIGLTVGDGGKLLLSNGDSSLADANNGQAVTFGALTGPGGAAVSIKRWIPITIDGNAGWIPHFGV